MRAFSPRSRQSRPPSSPRSTIAALNGVVPAAKSALQIHTVTGETDKDDDVVSVASTPSYPEHCHDEEAAEVSASASAPSELAVCSKSYWDHTRATIVRLTADGLAVAKAAVGPAGTIIATFETGEVVQTEVANICIVDSSLTPANVLKRPAARGEAGGRQVGKMSGELRLMKTQALMKMMQ